MKSIAAAGAVGVLWPGAARAACTAIPPSSWDVQLRSYQRRNGTLQRQLAAWRFNDRPGDARVAAWAALIGLARRLPHTPLKIALVNGWCNTVIAYDTYKGKFAQDTLDDPDWFQPCLQTVATGTGVCGDQALLKLETLHLAGCRQDDLCLAGAMVVDKESGMATANHALAIAVCGGQKWVLNNQQSGNSHPHAAFVENCFVEPAPLAFGPGNLIKPDQINRPIWLTDGGNIRKRCLRDSDAPRDMGLAGAGTLARRENEAQQFARLTAALTLEEKARVTRIERDAQTARQLPAAPPDHGGLARTRPPPLAAQSLPPRFM